MQMHKVIDVNCCDCPDIHFGSPDPCGVTGVSVTGLVDTDAPNGLCGPLPFSWLNGVVVPVTIAPCDLASGCLFCGPYSFAYSDSSATKSAGLIGCLGCENGWWRLALSVTASCTWDGLNWTSLGYFFRTEKKCGTGRRLCPPDSFTCTCYYPPDDPCSYPDLAATIHFGMGARLQAAANRTIAINDAAADILRPRIQPLLVPRQPAPEAAPELVAARQAICLQCSQWDTGITMTGQRRCDKTGQPVPAGCGVPTPCQRAAMTKDYWNTGNCPHGFFTPTNPPATGQ